jgi:hypothetical protein
VNRLVQIPDQVNEELGGDSAVGAVEHAVRHAPWL